MTRGPFHRVWVAYGVLVVGLALSVVAYVYVGRNLAQRQREKVGEQGKAFSNAAELAKNLVGPHLDRYTGALMATRGFIAGADDVTRSEWATFTRSLDLPGHFAGMKALGYVPRVEGDKLDAHVEAIRREMAGHGDAPQYAVTPVGLREVYFPVVYIEPFDARNRPSLGVDLMANPAYRAAMEAAIETFLPVASERVELRDATGNPHPGFLLFEPIYRNGAPTDTESQRRAALAGYIYAPVQSDALFTILLADRHDFDRLAFQIFDGPADPGHLLYDSRPGMSGTFSALPHAENRHTSSITVAGRTWTLQFADTSPAVTPEDPRVAILVLLGGLLVSWLLFGVSYLQARARITLESATAEIRKSQSALVASETRYRLKIEQSPMGIQTFSPDGTSLSVNHAWQELWQIPAEEMDRSGYNILRDAELERIGVLEQIRENFAGKTADIGPVLYQPPALPSGRRGRPRWVRIVMYPIKDDAGNTREMVCMFEDLTLRKEVEAELRRAKEEAEAANQAKDQFLAVLSHELRNPLAPVLMMVDVLERRDTDEHRAREAIEVIRRNVELEARLIDDLLDITRITRGKLALSLEPTDAHTVLAHALEICHSDIQGKRLHIGLEMKAENRFVMADAARLQQVFWNLIKNAVKFTPENGRITLRTSNHPASGAQGEGLVVDVIDSGIGIAPEKLTKIFEAFEQADRTITQRFGGLGLGLAISRALVEAHKGTIAASSPGPGAGTTFTVMLPVSKASPVEAPAERAAPAKTPRRRLLLVEDQADARRALTMLLGRAGYEVKSAGTAGEALELAASWRFDLLLSDLGLPDASGLDLIRDLRAKGHGSDASAVVPAIALTGLGMEEDIKAALAAGFDAHMTKPMEFDRLHTLIESLCGGRVGVATQG